MDFLEDKNLFSNTSNALNSAGSVVNGLLEMYNANSTYSMEKLQNRTLGLQADEIELQAEQAINDSLNNFNNSIGNIQYTSSKSGIKNTSQSIQNNIEKSSLNLGNTNSRNRRYTGSQATSLRKQEEINNFMAKANKKSSQANGLLDISKGFASFFQ